MEQYKSKERIQKEINAAGIVSVIRGSLYSTLDCFLTGGIPFLTGVGFFNPLYNKGDHVNSPNGKNPYKKTERIHYLISSTLSFGVNYTARHQEEIMDFVYKTIDKIS